MGFLDEYDVDLNDYNEAGFDVPAGVYAFEVRGGELRKGTASDDEALNIVVAFDLENEDGEAYSWNWWVNLPSDPDRPSRRAKISLSEWKKWLLGAGFDISEVNDVGPDDIEGISGTVRMVHTKGKGDNADKVYTNARDWAFDGEEEAPAPPKKSARAKSKPETEEEEEQEEAPKPTKARSTKKNPFEKK